MENMDHNAHSVYLMYYHLIMVVKYRRKVINDPISERAKEIWEYIAPRYGIVLEEWNHDIDHNQINTYIQKVIHFVILLLYKLLIPYHHLYQELLLDAYHVDHS